MTFSSQVFVVLCCSDVVCLFRVGKWLLNLSKIQILTKDRPIKDVSEALKLLLCGCGSYEPMSVLVKLQLSCNSRTGLRGLL